ncbi:TldD/PmbA family protein [Coprothermobacter platensis]|uniref:TldD/PmbA family protein n=1 Tax=Coprothermobacter platensis TaxID=108819 RepID=UPI0003640FB6|nr:TldD/PmbA family protein [Coprothermobacter platensis]
MKDFLEGLVQKALDQGATYADARRVRRRTEEIAVRDGRLEEVQESETDGYNIRVLMDGAFGFSASYNFDNAEKTVNEAVKIAKASSMASAKKLEWKAQAPVTGHYEGPCEIDPFKLPLDKKVSVLLEADKRMATRPELKHREHFLEFFEEEKEFFSSEGSYVTQHYVESGGQIQATAMDGTQIQVKSYPNSFGDFRKAGWEFIEEMDFVGHADEVADLAVALLSAPDLPQGVANLILLGPQLSLQVHESVGHATELDRVMGYEASYAGTSFATLDKLGKLQYGSKVMNITSDPTLPYGLGSFGWDDEGTPAHQVYLIKEGLLVDYLSDRETSSQIGHNSSGASRADGWWSLPIVRMTNVSLLPGDKTLEELMDMAGNGYMLDLNKNWSIDDKRLNFHFGAEAAWEIKNGKKGKLYKNPSYWGITPEFWNSLVAVAGPQEWRVWGLPNCGKGEPGQTMRVAHGTSPALFKNVKVGGNE